VIIRVWAPSAKSVDLVAGERRIALRPAAGRNVRTNAGAADPAGEGVWQTEVDESLLQLGYKYSIDGDAPIPDPRSRWQPDGVHGNSYLVPTWDEATARTGGFQAKPLEDSVIYELHVGTFTPEGTYAGAQAKLPHLVRLGVTHVELMPLATFPGRRGWGYDGVDLFAPFPAYGTPRELAEFVGACHTMGLGVLLDVVYNHLGPDGNHLAQYGQYFTDRYKTGWGAALNFDGPHSDAVRRFIIDNALMWLRNYGFDGLRLDAVHAVFSFGAVHVLEELAMAVKELGEKLGRRFLLIAESDLNDPRLVRAPSQGGFGLSAHWVDDFHHSLHRFFTAETDGYYADFEGLPDIATALRDGYVYQGRYSPHRGRRHGRAPKGLAANQLVVSAQNHDQIGNRAQGERLSMMLGAAQLKAIAALTILSPFVPLLFQGEEWGASTPFLYFTDHENAELGRQVAEGRSREFSSFRWQGVVPNPQELDTFARSKLDWSELSEPLHAEMYEWYRQLIRVRAGKRGRGKAAVRYDADARWLTFVHGAVLCVFNFASHAQRIRLPRGRWDLAMSSGSNSAAPGGEIQAEATLIYTRTTATTAV
jgi:maltooligosyltrehalose trehalohydrolase